MDDSRYNSPQNPWNGSVPPSNAQGQWENVQNSAPMPPTAAPGAADSAAPDPTTYIAPDLPTAPGYSAPPSTGQPSYGGQAASYDAVPTTYTAPPYDAAQGAYVSSPYDAASQPSQPYVAQQAGQASYDVPPVPPYAGEAYAPQQVPGAYPAQPPRKKRTGLYIGIGVGVLLLAVVALVGLFLVPDLLGSSTDAIDDALEIKDRDEPVVEPGIAGGASDASAEDAVRSQATALLDQLANADPAVLTQIGDIANEGFTNQMDASMETCGVNPVDYASAMLEGFTYEIDSVHAGEDSDYAVVTATIDCRDVFSLIDNFNVMLEAYMNSDAYQTSSVDEDMERVGYMFMESARTAEMWGGYPLTLEFSREGDAWVIDEDSWEDELDYLFDVE